MRLAVLILLASAILTSCAHRRAAGPLVYRYDVTSFRGMLIPPPAVPAKDGRLTVKLDDARGRPGANAGCDAAEGAFQLSWTKNAAELRFPQTKPSDPPPAFEAFRGQLQKLEDSGCLRPHGAARVAGAVANSLPQTSYSVFAFRYGPFEQTGSISLEPGLRLKTVAPLLKPGYTQAKVEVSGATDKPGPLTATVEGVEGYETAYYLLRPIESGGLKPELISVEHNRMGEISHPARTSALVLAFPPEARRLRLLTLRRASVSDRDIILLGAPEWSTLAEASRELETKPGAPERCAQMRTAWCFALPVQSVILIEMPVKVNGREVFVPVRGSIRTAIASAGVTKVEEQNKLLSIVQVRRPWRGRMIPVEFDRANPRSLDLPVTGGEEVTWDTSGGQ